MAAVWRRRRSGGKSGAGRGGAGGGAATHLHRLDDSQAAVELPLGYVVLDEPRNVRRHATRERRLARLHLGDKLRGQLPAHCQKIIARIARTLPARQAVSATGRRAADEEEDGRGGDNKQRQLWAITCVRSVQVEAGRGGHRCFKRSDQVRRRLIRDTHAHGDARAECCHCDGDALADRDRLPQHHIAKCVRQNSFLCGKLLRCSA